jgi:protein-serine/threonine kinase
MNPNNNNNNNNNNNQQSNRLQLNFGFQGAQNFGGAEQGRAFPTTPSTFPQPFPNTQGQQEVWGTAQPGMNGAGFPNQGYFANNPYTSAVQQQQAQQAQQQGYRPQPQQGHQQAQPQQQQQQYHDAATNGLVNQFSNQNLGGSQSHSQGSYARQASPNPNRPRTANSTHQQQQQQQQHYTGPSLFDDEPPAKNPERFSTTIGNRAKLQTELVGTFFKDSVERARDRNAR